MTNIKEVNFDKQKLEPNPNVTKVLNDAVKYAEENGAVTAICVVVSSKGAAFEAYTGTGYLLTAIGALEAVKLGFLDNVVGDPEPVDD